MLSTSTPQLQSGLLSWGNDHLRDLPWRRTRDPWAVLVSEIMLQQTQVSRVIERHREFLAQFPTASSCAAGTTADAIALWSGLGFNRRAVNLWRAAEMIDRDWGGKVPNDLSALLSLPGIGPYTARAVLAFAFEHDAAVVDTNVGRLLARWSGTSLKPTQAQQLADDLVPAGDSWRWNQTLLDFAVAVCDKRRPDCGNCPIFDACAWQGDGPDPAAGSAGVSTAQSRFEGSRRQVRGRIVDALRTAPRSIDDLFDLGQSNDTMSTITEIVDELVADGLAQRTDDLISLPTKA